MIRNGAQRMRQLIEHLLAFSRLDQQKLTRQDASMEALVRDALHDLSAEQRSRRIKFKIGELPAAEVDARLLQQVWG